MAMSAAAVGSILAALGWAGYEAAMLNVAGVSLVGSLQASAAAAVLAVLVCLPVVLPVGFLWHHARLGGRVRKWVLHDPTTSTAWLAVAALGLLATSVATFAAISVFEKLFASELVRKLAITGSMPAIVLAVGVAGRWALAPIRRLMARIGAKRAVYTVVGTGFAAAVGWAVALVFLVPSVFEQLPVSHYLGVGGALVGGVIGGIIGPKRWILAAGAAAAFALAGLGVAHTVTDASKELRLALADEESGVGYLLGLLPGDEPPSAGKVVTDGKSAVCKPGQRPPTASEVGEVGEEAPDIIFLTVDAMRWDRLPMSGYKRNTMPKLAAHARNAALFEQAYSTASSTRQTFRSMFAGVYSSRVEAPKSTKWGVSFANGQETLASYLKAAGFQTIALSSDPGAFPKKYGAFRGFEVVDESALHDQRKKTYSAPFKVDRIIAHLSNPDTRKRPKFVWTHFIEPHQPYQTGPDPKRWGKTASDRYDSALLFTDAEISRLLNFALGPDRRRRTIVIISADHGHAFREHGTRFHGKSVYQEEVHVPLIFWGPGIDKGRYDTPVSLIDLVPTTLDLVGLKVPEALCGTSLAPTLQKGKQPPERPIYVEQIPDQTTDHFGVALVRGKDKVVVRPAAKTVELFDLSKDPHEKHDLASEHPERLKEHLDVFRKFYHEHGLDPSRYGL